MKKAHMLNLWKCLCKLHPDPGNKRIDEEV